MNWAKVIPLELHSFFPSRSSLNLFCSLSRPIWGLIPTLCGTTYPGVMILNDPRIGIDCCCRSPLNTVQICSTIRHWQCHSAVPNTFCNPVQFDRHTSYITSALLLINRNSRPIDWRSAYWFNLFAAGHHIPEVNHRFTVDRSGRVLVSWHYSTGIVHVCVPWPTDHTTV